MDHVSLMFVYLAASANWMSRVCPHDGDSRVREGMGFSEMGACYFGNAGLRNTYSVFESDTDFLATRPARVRCYSLAESPYLTQNR